MEVASETPMSVPAEPPGDALDPQAKGTPHFERNKTLFWLLVAASLGLVWILLPFYAPIMWAFTLALMFAPLHRSLLKRMKGEANAAAVLTLLIVVALVVFPLVLVALAMAGDAAELNRRLMTGELNPMRYLQALFDTLPQWARLLLERLGLKDFESVERRSSAAMAQASQYVAAQALSIGMDTFDFVVGLFISLYLAFFMLRDGEQLARTLHTAFPLAPGYKYQLRNKFATVIRATIKGNFLIAGIQGALGGIAFWFLGIQGALSWAVLMALLSLLPAVGAGLVWVPVALYFFVTGAIWQSLALTAYGVLVIGLVDNVLRPALVGRDTRLPDYLVMITTLGGMAVFGINGFVLGPVIAALFIAVWHIHGTTRTDTAQ